KRSRQIDGPAGLDKLGDVQNRVSIDAQSSDAAVGIDIEPNVRPCLSVLNPEYVVGAAFERRLGQDLDPRRAEPVAGLDRTMLGIVAEKMAGVDVHAPDDPAQAKPHDAPIETGRPTAPRFPTVHPLPSARIFALNEDRLARLEQILFWGEEFVVGRENLSADPSR